MTDLEMTRLCAEAMEIAVTQYCLGNDPQSPGAVLRWHFMDVNVERRYDPLHDDAQAMALVKKFGLLLEQVDGTYWYASRMRSFRGQPHQDLNRSIVECVAKVQKGTS